MTENSLLVASVIAVVLLIVLGTMLSQHNIGKNLVGWCEAYKGKWQQTVCPSATCC